VVVVNGASVGLTYSMQVDATQSSTLDRDARNGLQVSVSRCGATFTICNVVYSGPAVSSNVPMGGPESVGPRQQAGLRPSTQDYLQLRVSFPLSATNPIQGATSVLRFTWISAQAL
jgi:hypothetical protein